MNLSALHDEFSEKELIGGLLTDAESFVNVHDLLRPDHFYSPELGAIYSAFTETYQHGNPADIMTLANKAGVSAGVVVSVMADVFMGAKRRTAQAIIELSQKRRIYRDLQIIAGSLKDSTVEELSGKITSVAVGIALDATQKRVLPTEKLIARVSELQETRRKDPGVIRGIHTGYPCLDLTLRGLRPRRMTLLVAATGFGKSTLAVNIFSNVVQTGTKSLLISTENDIDDNLDRMCGITSGLELREIEGGYRAEHVTECFARRFKDKVAFVSDSSPRTIHEVVGTIARHVLQNGVELVFVDYIGEIALDGVKNENEEARLTRYSQALLEASRTLNCHIVVLAQLNREGNRKGRPSKTELQGCFKMAQKAHSLLIFWQNEEGKDILTVDKNRQAPSRADIAMKFQRTTQRITELGYWLEDEKRVVPPSNAPRNISDYVDLDSP
jgi:replicative DNA helicase